MADKFKGKVFPGAFGDVVAVTVREGGVTLFFRDSSIALKNSDARALARFLLKQVD